MTSRPVVAIAGATGFVGRALMQGMGATQPLLALSRHVPEHSEHAAWQWRSCNLFNLLHTEKALQGAEVAFYLVHSMSPQAALAQGHFADMDLICADNFARAAKSCGVRRIIYLSGIIPKNAALSEHLESRKEVERTLAAHTVPVTTLRAGLVLGPGGSSFDMMLRLVKRLPIMVTPGWTRSRTQPVALQDVVTLLLYVLDHPESQTHSYDIGCPEILTYQDMMQQTARALGRRIRFLTVPLTQLRLSLLWVSLITQTPRQLVLPLVQSLRHDMVAADGLILQQRAQLTPKTFDQALHDALHEEPAPKPGKARKPDLVAVRTVLSVQRLPLPKGADAKWVSEEYARWLPQFLWPLLRVDVQDARLYRFCLPFGRQPLLELSFAPQRSSADRQLFYITGGVLAKLPRAEHGRFEFRTVLDRQYVLSAVHDFVPRLPWYFYKATQALVHRMVMYFFGKHLKRVINL